VAFSSIEVKQGEKRPGLISFSKWILVGVAVVLPPLENAFNSGVAVQLPPQRCSENRLRPRQFKQGREAAEKIFGFAARGFAVPA
jgi:hypothetical protein